LFQQPVGNYSSLHHSDDKDGIQNDSYSYNSGAHLVHANHHDRIENANNGGFMGNDGQVLREDPRTSTDIDRDGHSMTTPTDFNIDNQQPDARVMTCLELIAKQDF